MTNKLVQQLVEDYYKLNIKSKTRRREFVEARNIYFKLLRDNTLMTTAAIGKTMKKDHTTVLHSCKRMNEWLCYDKKIQNDYNILNTRLKKAIASNPDLFKDSVTIEGFYEQEYERYKQDSNFRYRVLVNKYNFLKSRLEKYEPNRVERGEFDLV